jgi:hypothetical protein
MFSTIFSKPIQKIGFEDMQFVLKNTNQFIIINTLPENEQICLIKNTLSYHLEEEVVNELLNSYDLKSKKFVIYGKNSSDSSIDKKYSQLNNLGFIHIYLYVGGLFEWLLLQDVYGKDEFPTTSRVLDILKYKPDKSIISRY